MKTGTKQPSGSDVSWAFRPRWIEGELLSSYLARAAHAHGSTAGAFCRRHLQDSWFFTRDVDRGVADDQHARIGELAGLAVVEVHAMTLRRLADALGLATPTVAPPAVTPWVNAVGIQQAKRRHRALAYCPECLGEQGAALQRWRLSFHTWCVRHRLPLLDRCLRCSASFVPHLARRSLRQCHDCGEILRGPAVAQAAESAFQLQQLMDSWLALSLGGCMESHERFQALRVLASIGIHARHAKPECASVSEVDALPRYARLEFLGCGHRMQVLAWLGELVSGWPRSFRKLADDAGLTQRSFARSGVPGMKSSWLRAEVEVLPVGHTRRRVSDATRLTETLAAAQRGVSSNWRAHRAEILMRQVVNGR